MSSPRGVKILEGLAEQLHRMGYAQAISTTGQKVCIRWLGRGADGRDTARIDLTAATWATANLNVLVALNPATDANNTAALKTQSHAQGLFLDGSVNVSVYMETPADYTSAHAQFVQEIMHILRGQLGAPVIMNLTANGTKPTLNGVDGAVADVVGTQVKEFLPYGMTYSGGI